ncbi:MAG TPA: glycogen debranching protein GlgX, partial [Pyrinomonadaceae bacterium]|nr:glycogen debranching protein GlgX [Pyrinomonadaceae bacterium]
MNADDTTILAGQPEFMTASGPQRGAFWDGHGVNFSIASKNAQKVELCLFDASGEHELRRLTLPGHTGNVFHGYVPEIEPGQVYGYRVYGPYDPGRGLLFNPAKLLFDPCARGAAGRFIYNDAHNGASPLDPYRPDPRDNAPYMLKSRVAAPFQVPEKDEKPGFSRPRTIIYEANIPSLTSASLPDYDYKISYSDNVITRSDLSLVPQPIIPGTASALTSPQVVNQIKRHGNTVELMPINAGLSERRLVRLGLNNVWNYNSLGFFAPDPKLFPGGAAQVRETVKELHKAGFKVVLDFAFNHTCEIDDTGHRGYTLSLRGVDNSTYYRLDPNDKTKYLNWSGCGNTINADEPETQRLILDALRYWIKEIGADGIRFDLGAILGRDASGRFSPDHPLMKAIMSDPIISNAELFFEPWSADGYNLGELPAGAAEWNDKYRDCVRDYWRGDDGAMAELAKRITGSHDIFGHKSASPQISVNAIAFHDGLTARDIVSYNEKHNLENQENNRDGHNNNHSYNHGVEGPTDDTEINRIRWQQMRNMRATLFLSQGTPLVLQGDEVGNSQNGNNNGYCRDKGVDWDNGPEARRFEDFAAYVKSLRDEFAILRHHEYLHGEKFDGHGVPNIDWYAPDNRRQTHADWSNSNARCFGLMLNGGAVVQLDGPKDNRRLLAVFNAHSAPVDFTLPALKGGSG